MAGLSEKGNGVSNAYEVAKAVVLARNADAGECEHCKPYVDELIRNENEQQRQAFHDNAR